MNKCDLIGRKTGFAVLLASLALVASGSGRPETSYLVGSR
jgi:hypothetical protein